MPNPENVIGKGRRFSAGDQPTIECASKGGKARQKQVRMMRLMKSFLSASPEMSDGMLAGFHKLGIDTENPDNLTVAAIMSLQVVKQAIGGDLDAVKMAFEMAGEAVDAKTQLEREKIALEKKKLALQGKPSTSDLPTIVINTDEQQP